MRAKIMRLYSGADSRFFAIKRLFYPNFIPISNTLTMHPLFVAIKTKFAGIDAFCSFYAAFSLSELLLTGLIASLQTPISVAWLDHIDGFRLELAGLAAVLFVLSVAHTKGMFWAGL